MRTIILTLLAIYTSLALHAQQADYKPMTYSSTGYNMKKPVYITRMAPRYIVNDKKYAGEWDSYLYNIYQSYAAASKSKQFIIEPYVVQYLQAVLKPILDSNNIKTKIEIVCTRYKEANAYNMGDNRLYVNIGLLQLLDNEAQLAFLLCHELSHQILQHAQEKFYEHRMVVADKNIKKEMKDIRRAKYNKLDRSVQFALKYDYIFANYSRAKERAADSMAIVLLQNTRYDIREGKQLMSLLKQSDTDMIQLDYSRYLGNDHYIIKKEWLQSNRSNISFGHKRAISYEEDSVKTHPDIPERIAFIEHSVQAMDNHKNTDRFVVGKPAFDSIKAAARYEIIESFAANKRYAATIYYTLHLLDEQPDNLYLIKKAATTMKDVISAVKNHTIQSYVPVETEDNSVAYNQLLRIIDRTSLEDLNQLYNNFLDRYAKQLGNNPEFKRTDEKTKS